MGGLIVSDSGGSTSTPPTLPDRANQTDDSSDIDAILEKNRDKNWVKRIMDPDDYPVLENEDGSYSTHSMASGSDDRGHYVYPTVVQGDDGEMVRLSNDEAWVRARDSGDRITFDSQEEAIAFSKRYKESKKFREYLERNKR